MSPDNAGQYMGFKDKPDASMIRLAKSRIDMGRPLPTLRNL